MVRRLLLAAVLLLAALPAAAQAPVRGYFDLERITPGDSFNYVIESNQEMRFRRGQLPEAQGEAAEFIPGVRQQRILNSSGSGRQATTVYQYLFAMRAVKPGSFLVSPITVDVGGQEVTVSGVAGVVQTVPSFSREELPGQLGIPNLPDAGRARALGETFFSTVEVSNESPLPGEPIEVVTQVYYSGNGEFSISAVGEPVTSRFVRVPEADASFSTRQERVEVDGRPFRRIAGHRMIIVPTQAGEAEIQGAEIGVGRSMGGFFARTMIDFVLRRPTRTISVRPLPAEPDGVIAQFVGDFTIGVTADREELSEGELVTVEVYVSGDGFLETAGLGDLPSVDGLSPVSDEVAYDASIVGGRLVSRKSFKHVYQAVAAGTLEVPSMRFALVDPKSGEQTIRTTDPIELKVTPAARSSLQLADSADSPRRAEARELSREGILYIDESPLSTRTLADSRTPLVQLPWYWLGHAVPVLLLGAYAALVGWQRRRDSDAGVVRARSARQRGSEALKEARRLLAAGEPGAFHAALASGLTSHVTSVLGREAAGMTAEEACACLSERGLADEARELRRLLERCDAMRFAPVGTAEGREADLRAAEEFVQRLAKAPGRR